MAAHQLCLPSCRPHCCHPCLVCLSCSDVWLVARFLLRTMAALIRCYLRCFLRPVFKVKSFLFCKQSVRLMYYHWWKKGLWSRFATAISRGCATATERARLKAPPFSRGCLRTATKGPSTWAPGGRRGGGPLVAVLLANRD